MGKSSPSYSPSRPGMTSYEGLRHLLQDNVPDIDGPVDMDDYVDFGWKQRERRKDLAGSLSSIDESEAERQYNISKPRNLEGEEDAVHAKAAEALLRVIEAKQLDLDSVISKLRSHKNNKRKALHDAGYGTGSLAGLKKIDRGVSVAHMHNPIDIDDFSADDTSINSDYSNLSTISANHRRIAKNTQKLASHIMNTPQDKFTAKRNHLALKDDPEYSLYFRMLRYGFTMGAVRAALQRDGKPDITRLDPDKPVYLQRVPKVAATLTSHTTEELLNESSTSLQSNGSLKRNKSIEVSGLEFGDNGLTDKGWESALETARAKSGVMNSNTPNTGVKTPAYRKSASGGSGRGNSTSSVLSKSAPPKQQSAPRVAVSTPPPWLQSNVERGICEGWLRKRTRRGRWVRRWYLIDSTGIYYSHSPPTASSALFSKKVVKLVDARMLGAKKVRENPIEFEVWHPSKNQAIVSLRANSVVEMQQWVDAVNSTSERQRLMDEVVVGSVIPENLVKNTVGMIEQNNAMHNNGYTNANYRPVSPSASVRSGGSRSSRYSQQNLSGSKKKLETILGDEYDSDGDDEDSSDEGSIISRHAMEKFKKLLSEGSLPSDVNATELSDKPKRPKLERQNSWPPLSLMSDGTHGTGESETKSKEEVEADLKRIEDDIKRLNAIEEEGPSNPTEISTSGGGGGGGSGDGKGGTGNGDGADGGKKEGEGSTDANKDAEPKLKDDPKYDKYFKMMKMGLPKEVAQHAMTRDQMDPSILDLDPEKSLKSQLTPKEGEGGDDDGPPLKDDPKYVKYYKMMKMGLPKEAVQHAMTRDQLDPSILDLDPEKSLKSQTESKADADTGPPLKEDPQYIKYFKMMKMGLPKEAAKHAMVRDGLDPNILDMDPEKSLKSQTEPAKEDTGPPLKDDPKYGKFVL